MRETDLQPQRKKLTEADKDAIRDLLFDSVETEFFQPLNLIALNREYLQTHLEQEKEHFSPEKANHALEGIRMASQQLDRQMENCLDIMACLRGRAQPQIVTLDLCALVNDLVAQIAPAAAILKLQITAKMPETPILVQADCAMTERILLNFISNAFRASDPGETVSLCMKTDAESGAVRLMVKNHGVAIPQKLADKAFEPGRLRAAPGRERFLGGSGLGLCLCGEFCRLLGWKPAMRSTEKETNVWVEIPQTGLVPAGRLVLHSDDSSQMQQEKLFAAVRRELRSVPGLNEIEW